MSFIDIKIWTEYVYVNNLNKAKVCVTKTYFYVLNI